MQNELSTKRLKKRLFLILSATVFLLFVLLVSAITYMQDRRSAMEEEKFHTLIHSSKKHIIDNHIHIYKNLAKRAVEQKEVKTFIRNRDREGLYTFYEQRWKAYQKENPYFTIFHFLLPDGTSFLRMHKPEKFGDRLDDVRPMIKEIHKSRKTLVGYETGKMSTVFRIITPIFDGNEYIGTLDIGLNPNFLIEKMKEITGIPSIVFIKESNLKLFKRESGFKAKGYLLQSKIDDEMTELLNAVDKEHIFRDNYQFDHKGKTYMLHVEELKDYLGEPKVKILFFRDVTFAVQGKQQLLGIFVFFSSLVFFILIFFIGRQMNVFESGLKKLHKKHSNDLEHLNGVLRVISDVNQNMVKIKGQNLLLEKICTDLIANNIFNSAWIALYDKNGHIYKVTSEGLGAEASSFKENLLLGGYKPYCLEHIGQKKVLLVENPSRLCGKCALKNTYPKDSGIVLKLEHEGKSYGIMGLSAPKVYLYDEKINALLIEVANDIAFALYGIEVEEALKKSEAEMKSIFRAAPIGIGLVSNRVLLNVNEKFCKITGYAKDELIGKNARMIYPSDEDFEYVGREKYRQIKKYGTGTVETRFKCKDGKIIDVLMSSTPIDLDNLSAGVTFTALDITERKLLEDEIRASKQQFERFMEYIPANVVMKDTNNRIVYANSASAHFFDKESIVGMNAYELLPKNISDKLAVLNKEAKQSGYGEAVIEYTDQDKKHYIYRVMTFAIGEKEENLQTGSMYFDITDKYKDQHEIAKFKQILENSPVSIVITDIDGNMEYVNPWFCHLTGYSPEEAIGQNPNILKSNYHSEKEYVELWDKISHDNVWSGTFKNIKKNGEEYWESAIIAPVKNETGEIVNYIGIKQEITEQMHLKEELKDKEEIMIAQSRHAAMGEMISMIAHQWRQPISIIGMVANNMLIDIELEEVSEEGYGKQARSILEQTEYLSKTIDDFRNFFRPEKGKDKVSIEKVFAEAEKIIGKSLENNSVALSVKCEKGIEVTTYSRELLQVYINLLKNAKEALVEYRPEDRRIDVVISDDAKNVVTTICDNGGGIDEAIMGKIFDPYFSTKDEKTGTGLGLYMSKTIVEKHLHGTISVENTEDGACLRVAIPLKWEGADSEQYKSNV